MRRVCVLTGASGALGTAFIERYCERYEILAVHNRRPIRHATQAQRFFDPLAPEAPSTANDHPVRAIRADLSTAGGVRRLVDELADHGRVDVVVNAAVVRHPSHLLAAGALEPAELMLHVNVLAPIRLAVGLAQRLWRSDPDENARLRRNVVNVSSTAGLFVYPDLGQALYGTTKAALNHVTYHLALELWDVGVRVNALAPDTFPGRVSTEDVLDQIVAFDDGEETGQVVPMHASAALASGSAP